MQTLPDHSPSTIKNCLRLLRPYQWIKNLLLFSPLFFSGNLFDKTLIITGIGVIVFCLVSGMGYVLNDWVDKKNDCHHFNKKNRPFASGALQGRHGLILSIALLVIILLILSIARPAPLFLFYLAAYAGLTLVYSLYLKQVVILEIFAVASGFVLRVLAGGAVGHVVISNWLFLTVFFIAMMISIAKRLNELKELGEKDAVLHRESQAGYSLNYLNSMLWACGSITLVVYSLYAVEHGRMVMYSVIPATYGIFRFIYLTDQGKGSDPIKTLFSDRQLLLTTLIFLFFLAFAIY